MPTIKADVSEAIDKFTNTFTPSRNFTIWHVEALLNQSADLLDRCLAEMRAIEALDASWYLLEHHAKENDKQWQDRDNLFVKGEELEQAPVLLKRAQEATHAAKLELDEAVKNEKTVSPRYHYLSQIEQLKGEEDNIKAKRNWAKVKKDLVFNAHAADRIILNDRNKASKSGQPLAYNEQARAAKERLVRDYKDAYNRMFSASLGLTTLFGYQAPLTETVDIDGQLNQSILWVRNAIGWLTAFMQRDQGFSATLSIKELVGEAKWGEEIENPGDTLEFTIRVLEKMLNDHSSVRLRGVSAFIVSTTLGVTPWSMVITLPHNAIITHDSKQTENAKKVSVDQALLPSLTLGRVENRRSCRSPEIVGMTSTRNASAIGDNDTKGEMSVKVSIPKSEQQITPEALDDIQIEMTFVGRPK